MIIFIYKWELSYVILPVPIISRSLTKIYDVWRSRLKDDDDFMDTICPKLDHGDTERCHFSFRRISFGKVGQCAAQISTRTWLGRGDSFYGIQLRTAKPQTWYRNTWPSTQACIRKRASNFPKVISFLCWCLRKSSSRKSWQTVIWTQSRYSVPTRPVFQIDFRNGLYIYI